jgi:hypothetical protein
MDMKITRIIIPVPPFLLVVLLHAVVLVEMGEMVDLIPILQVQQVLLVDVLGEMEVMAEELFVRSIAVTPAQPMELMEQQGQMAQTELWVVQVVLEGLAVRFGPLEHKQGKGLQVNAGVVVEAEVVEAPNKEPFAMMDAVRTEVAEAEAAMEEREERGDTEEDLPLVFSCSIMVPMVPSMIALYKQALQELVELAGLAGLAGLAVLVAPVVVVVVMLVREGMEETVAQVAQVAQVELGQREFLINYI